MTRHREVETKFDVKPDVDLDAVLADLARHEHTRDLVASVGEPVVTELVATYVDTADLALARNGVTLRRRTGGSDAGWHLKLRTAADEKLEVRRPLGRSVRSVPPALLDEVRPVVRDSAVAPVAVVTTHRVEHALMAGDGSTLAVLADDTVRAVRTGQDDTEAVTWRELEVELATGDRRLLTAVGKVLRTHGIARSRSSSKLGRVLGDPRPGRRPQSGPDAGTAGRALHELLAALVADLHAQDRAARAGEVDGVHDMRVTARRIRAALAVHRPVLDRGRTEPLRDELDWLGHQLGALRDVHVVDERLTGNLADQPAALVVGPVRRRLATELRAREKVAEAGLREALASARYYRLLDVLDDLLAEPAYTDVGERPARKVLRRLVRRTVRRVRKRAALLVDAETAVGAEERNRRLHELRKAVRRCRYAAEAARPVLGADADRLGRRMHALQDVLGEHQDAVTVGALLRVLAEVAHTAGESAFTYGVLQGAEVTRGREARRNHPALLRRALNGKATGWLG